MNCGGAYGRDWHVGVTVAVSGKSTHGGACLDNESEALSDTYDILSTTLVTGCHPFTSDLTRSRPQSFATATRPGEGCFKTCMRCPLSVPTPSTSPVLVIVSSDHLAAAGMAHSAL